MKKFTKILTAAAVLLSTLLITGCGAAENLKEALSAPKDTWFRKEVTYKSGSGETEESTDLVVYMCYSDTGYTASNLKKGVTFESGLTVVVIAKNQDSSNTVNEVVNGLVHGKYLLKTFSDKKETEVDADGETSTGKKSITMSPTKWNIIYNSVQMEKEDGTIDIFTTNSLWEKIDDPSNFSWKKIMGNYVLEKLLDD